MGLFFPDYGTSFRRAGGQRYPLIGVAAAHAALFGLIAITTPAEQLSNLTRPFSARLIESQPRLAPPLPPPPPPKQAAKRIPAAAQPILAAKATAPADDGAAFSVRPQPPASSTASPGASFAPLTPTITAARFDADYLDNPKPLYPHASRRLREEGKVLLRVRVSAAGHAESVEIKHSSGFPRLDQAAEEVVSRWRFVPARRGDEAVAAWVQVPITFNLQG